MRTEQPSQPPERSDEDRIQQIEKDLYSLDAQLLKIQEWLHYAEERLKAADGSPP